MMNKVLQKCAIFVLFVLGTNSVLGQVAKDVKPSIPLDDLRVFAEVFAKIKSDYVEEVSDKKLLEDAVRGMLAGLDPHSTYLDGENFKNMRENTSGHFGGLGIEVTMENGFVKVIAPIDDTPAQRAGIKAGDLITKLNDTTVRGMSLNDAVNIMRGRPKEPITLTIMRKGEETPLVITVIRDIIHIRSVKSDTLFPGFGYLRIASFQSQTTVDLHRAIEKLQKDNDQNLKGVVLDLRNNPGGILDAAVGVSDTFLDSGMIVYTEGRIHDSQLKFYATPSVQLSGIPIIVLVNAGSASASEIVAGALQDHDRGIIMGSKTFGKGSVQTVLPMNNNVALKLTTARYYTPNGRSIQVSGITPDIVVDKVHLAQNSNAIDALTEEDLARHLGNTQDINNEHDLNAEVLADDEELPLSVTDYVLYEALNVLKGLAIVR